MSLVFFPTTRRTADSALLACGPVNGMIAADGRSARAVERSSSKATM
jgi:hypothetical protein